MAAAFAPAISSWRWAIRVDRSWVPTALHGTKQFVPDVWNETELSATAQRRARARWIVGSGPRWSTAMALSLAEPWRRIHVGVPERAVAVGAPRRWVRCRRQHSPRVDDLVGGVRWSSGNLPVRWPMGSTGARVSILLRPVTNDLWQRLNRADRVEFLARDVRTWDVHRHRMPPHRHVGSTDSSRVDGCGPAGPESQTHSW